MAKKAKSKKKEKDRPLHFLLEWRTFRKMTGEDLADAVGTTKGVISLIESGDRGLSDKWAWFVPLTQVTP